MMLPWAGLYELAARGRGLICRGLIFRFSSIFVSVENRAPSRSRKLGMTFANFLDLGVPHSQPKRKLINISGERGNYLSLHKKRPTYRHNQHIGTTNILSHDFLGEA